MEPHITKLHASSEDYLDLEGRRLCVAPTVYQCVMSISTEGQFHIYEVNVDDPIPAINDHNNVADYHITYEHRVTPKTLRQAGGKIPVKRVGVVEVNSTLKTKFKIVFGRGGNAIDSQREKKLIWNTDGEEWLPQFESHTLRKQLPSP